MTIKDIVEGGKAQAAKYIEIIAKGKPKNYSESGVLDNQIKIDEIGQDTIQGHVIVAIGGARVIAQSLLPVGTSYNYDSMKLY